MKRLSFILIILVTALMSGCYYDNEAVLYPDTGCTAGTVGTFQAVVLPLLNHRCNSCHSGSYPSGSIRLDSYTEVIKYVNVGSLMGSINHDSGYSPMPKNSSKMSACDIQKIQSWVDAGAANN